MTIQFLVILLLGILLCVQWIWLRRAERIQNTAVRGEIEGAGMAALQSMTVPMILAERDGKILWSNAIFQNRFVSGRSVLGRSVQDVIHLNLAALDQNRDLLMEHNGLSYRVHAVSSAQNQQEIIAVQFLEITDILRLQHEQTNSRPCVMLLVIDSCNTPEKAKRHRFPPRWNGCWKTLCRGPRALSARWKTICSMR